MSKNELGTVLNQPTIDVKELYQQWGVSTPWRSTGRFEPLQIFAGKLLYRQTLYNESRFMDLNFTIIKLMASKYIG